MLWAVGAGVALGWAGVARGTLAAAPRHGSVACASFLFEGTTTHRAYVRAQSQSASNGRRSGARARSASQSEGEHGGATERRPAQGAPPPRCALAAASMAKKGQDIEAGPNAGPVPYSIQPEPLFAMNGVGAGRTLMGREVSAHFTKSRFDLRVRNPPDGPMGGMTACWAGQSSRARGARRHRLQGSASVQLFRLRLAAAPANQIDAAPRPLLCSSCIDARAGLPVCLHWVPLRCPRPAACPREPPYRCAPPPAPKTHRRRMPTPFRNLAVLLVSPRLSVPTSTPASTTPVTSRALPHTSRVSVLPCSWSTHGSHPQRDFGASLWRRDAACSTRERARLLRAYASVHGMPAAYGENSFPDKPPPSFFAMVCWGLLRGDAVLQAARARAVTHRSACSHRARSTPNFLALRPTGLRGGQGPHDHYSAGGRLCEPTAGAVQCVLGVLDWQRHGPRGFRDPVTSAPPLRRAARTRPLMSSGLSLSRCR
jgi:hypothetical protein